MNTTLLTLYICIILFQSSTANYLTQYSQRLFPSSSSTGTVKSKSLRTQNDQIYVAGSFSGNVDFYGTSLNSNGSNDAIFIAKFSSLDLDSTEFVVQYGQSGTDTLNDFVLDADTNMIFGGNLNGISNYGGADLDATLSQDAILVKLDPNGNHIWSAKIGTDIAVDSYVLNINLLTNRISKIAVNDENIFVAGTVNGTMNWGGNTFPSHGGYDVAVAMFNGSNGDHLWSLALGGDEDDTPAGIAADLISNCFVLANSLSSIIDINGTVHSLEAGSAVILIKMDSNGTLLWHKYFNSSQSEFAGNGIAVDSLGNVYITGSFVTANFGSGVRTAGGAQPDLYLAKFYGDGSLNWVSTFGASGESEGGNSIQLATDGSVMLAGYYSGAYVVMGAVFSSIYPAAFAANFNASGSLQWAIATASDGTSMSDMLIAPTSSSEYAAIITTFSGIACRDFTDTSITGYGTLSTLIAVVGNPAAQPSPSHSPFPSSSAGVSATKTYSVTSLQFWNGSLGHTSASDSKGNLYVGGTWIPNYGMMLIKYNPEAKTNVYEKNLGNFTTVNDIAIDSQDNAIVAIATTGVVDFGNGTSLSSEGYCLAKYDQDGNFTWAFCEAEIYLYVDEFFFADLNLRANVIFTGQNDEIYVFGSYQSSSISPKYFFAAKHSSDGQRQWLQTYDFSLYNSPLLFATESADGQYIYFGGSPAVVFKASASNGDLTWTIDLTADLETSLLWIATVDSNNLILSGRCKSLNASGSVVSSFHGDMDICFVGLTAGGQVMWTKFIGGDGTEYPTSISSGPDDSIVVAGYYDGASCFFGGDYVTNGSYFVALYEAGGNYLWSDTSASNSGYWIQSATVLSSSDSFFIVGYADSSLTLEGVQHSYSVSEPATVALQYSGPKKKAPKGDSGFVLKLWMIIVIAVGGALLLGIALFVIIRKKMADNDDEDDNQYQL